MTGMRLAAIARSAALLRRAAAAVLVACAAATAAFGEDAGDAFRLRAMDRSAAIDAEIERRPAAEAPIRGRRVSALVTGAGGSSEFETTIDAEGMLSIPRASVPKGSTLALRIGRPDAPEFIAIGIDPWAEPAPDRADFLRIATSSPLYIPFVNLVVTGQDVGKPSSYIRTNVIAQIVNPSAEIWTGSRPGDPSGLIRFPVPAGSKIVSAKRGNEDVECTIQTSPSGRTEAVLSSNLFAPQAQFLYRIVLTAPWQEGGRFDASFSADLPIGEWNLVLDSANFSYDANAGGGTPLADGGLQPGVNGIESRVWLLRDIDPGTPVSQVFLQGRIIDPKVWRTLTIFALTVAGAILLAKALASRGGPAADTEPAPAPDAPADPAADNAADLEALRLRHVRGEITEFEYKARRALLTNDRPAPKPAAGATDPLARVREIETRAATADPAQLRADVRTLTALVRELLRK